MAQLFYDENDPRKKREMRGDKTPIDIAMNDGPSTPVGIYTKSDGTKVVEPKAQPFKIRKLKGKATLPPV